MRILYYQGNINDKKNIHSHRVMYEISQPDCIIIAHCTISCVCVCVCTLSRHRRRLRDWWFSAPHQPHLVVGRRQLTASSYPTIINIMLLSQKCTPSPTVLSHTNTHATVSARDHCRHHGATFSIVPTLIVTPPAPSLNATSLNWKISNATIIHLQLYIKYTY